MRKPAATLIAAALLALSAPAAASASDNLYFNSGNTISFARLDGSGGGQLPTTGATVSFGEGLAIDLSAGRIYWANNANNTISFAKLDGSGGGGQLPTTGATLDQPSGVAIDPATGRIYWANFGNQTISFAKLDGSGGGQLPTTGATLNNPFGVAIDPADGRIFWSNVGNATISFARLDGTGGGGQLPTTGATVSSPEGVAIDAAAGRIYWANNSIDTISFANLDGSGGGGQLATTGAMPANPRGVGIDPAAGKIYWGNAGSGSISFARLDGSGGGQLDTTGAPPLSVPAFPTLLETPSSAGAPQISGDSAPGSVLTCSQAGWAPDLPPSFLYRAPQSTGFQWSRGGSDIAGAIASSYTADLAGEYRCAGTATNPAGTAEQTSAPFTVQTPPIPPSNIFTAGKPKLNKKRGTATLTVIVPGPGTLSLIGSGVVKQRPARASNVRALPKTVTAAGKVTLLIKPKGTAKFKLEQTGNVKVKVTLTFTPTGGAPAAQAKTVKLIKTKR